MTHSKNFVTHLLKNGDIDKSIEHFYNLIRRGCYFNDLDKNSVTFNIIFEDYSEIFITKSTVIIMSENSEHEIYEFHNPHIPADNSSELKFFKNIYG